MKYLEEQPSSVFDGAMELIRLHGQTMLCAPETKDRQRQITPFSEIPSMASQTLNAPK